MQMFHFLLTELSDQTTLQSLFCGFICKIHQIIICPSNQGLKEQSSAIHFKLFSKTQLRVTPHIHILVWTHSVEAQTCLSINTAGDIVDVIYANCSLIVDESCFTKEVIKEQFLYYMEESTCFLFTHSNINYHPRVLFLFSFFIY